MTPVTGLVLARSRRNGIISQSNIVHFRGVSVVFPRSKHCFFFFQPRYDPEQSISCWWRLRADVGLETNKDQDPKYGASSASSPKPYNFPKLANKRSGPASPPSRKPHGGLLYKLESTMHRHSKEGSKRALTWGPCRAY